MNISVSLFMSPSKDGIALEAQLIENITKYIESALKEANQLTNNQFQYLSLEPVFRSIQRCASENEFLKAQLVDDLVIFDGALEDTGLKLGDNYSCTGHAPYLMDNVIVVSRTVLPINYIPTTTNVSPIGEEEKIIEPTGQLISKKTFTNDEIGVWLIDTLSQWIADERIPRKNEFKRDLASIEELLNGKHLKKSAQQIVDELMDISEQTKIYLKNKYEHTAFISYRSHYAKNKSNGYSVEDLKKYILDYHKKQDPDENWNVLYYYQGTLAQDCMTEFRRWGLMSYVDNIFKKVPEVWIFNTHDTKYGPSYWDSWFTQGEIISLIMLHQELPELCPRIIEFDTSTGMHRKIEPQELPGIRDENKYYLDLITANSEILYGDYSALVGMQKIKRLTKNMFPIFQKFFLKTLSLLFGYNLEKAFNSHAYDSSFMSNRIISCKDCLKKGFSIDSFADPVFIRNFMDISSVDPEKRKIIAQRGYFSLNESEFEESLKTGTVTCPHCKSKFAIKLLDDSIFIWRHKFNNPAIDFDGFIEKVSLYQVE